MPDLCLDWLTCPQTNPVDLIKMAADLEAPLVSLQVYAGPTGGRSDWGLLGATPMRRATRDICRSAGVKIDVIESFYLRPETDLEAFLPAFETGAWLGARRVNFVTQDPEPNRLLERTHQFLDMAAVHGLEMLLEFTPRMTQKTLADAIAFRAALGRPELRIQADSLHVNRSLTPLSDIAAQSAEVIGRAQLCDGPATMSAAEGQTEALHRRMMPGDGALPLVDFLAALPAGIVIALEVPQDGFTDLPGTLEGRVSRGMATMRDYIKQAEGLRARARAELKA